MAFLRILIFKTLIVSYYITALLQIIFWHTQTDYGFIFFLDRNEFPGSLRVPRRLLPFLPRELGDGQPPALASAAEGRLGHRHLGGPGLHPLPEEDLYCVIVKTKIVDLYCVIVKTEIWDLYYVIVKTQIGDLYCVIVKTQILDLHCVIVKTEYVDFYCVIVKTKMVSYGCKVIPPIRYMTVNSVDLLF